MDTRIKERGRILPGLRREEGASMVEFAIVAPLLFVLLFGIIEFSIVLYNQAVITNASREGARYAAMYYINPSTQQPQLPSCPDVSNYVTNYVTKTQYLISFTNPPPSPTVTCPLQDVNEGAAVGNVWQVQVSYPYNFLVFGSLITLLGNGSITNPLTLTAKTVMRDENQ
jgi:Flp pilus assembly protein TadG